MEALSLNDNGKAVQFNVYCYNVQPTIIIDYKTGASRLENEPLTPQIPSSEAEDSNIEAGKSGVYRTPSGKKYHLDAECGGKNSYSVTMEEALEKGLTPCSKCAE